MQDIYEAINAVGIVNIEPQWRGDKQRAGKNYCEWFYGHEKYVKDKLYRWASFGNWSLYGDQIFEWNSYANEKLSKSVRTELENHQLLLAEQKAKKERDNHDQTRQRVNAEFASLSPGDLEIYLRRKCISLPFGAKVSVAATPLEPSQVPHLVIPVRDFDGTLWSLQHIYHEGAKCFERGGKKKGLFFLLETTHHCDWTLFKPQDSIFIAEGFATAASIQEALGPDSYILCAFDAGNLRPVSSGARQRYPKARIILCADNDCDTIIDGKHHNTGVIAAEKAAKGCGGAVVVPDSGGNSGGNNGGKSADWNDVHCTSDLASVKDQIMRQVSENNNSQKNESNSGKIANSDIEPLFLMDSKGKPRPTSAQECADYLLEWFGDRICTQDDSIFTYQETHWHELNKQDLNRIYQQIDFITHKCMEPKTLSQYYIHFLKYLPKIPAGTSMFTPNPFVANFKDQTLHFSRNPSGTYRLDARPHKASDYLTHVLPFNMPKMSGGAVDLPPAPKFEKWLDNLWANDKDKEQKKRLFYQVGGCCILPAFTTIVFFIGPPASGKSTIIKLLIKLIGSQNTCSVQPCLWNNFNMEPMIGKLINYDTDIDVNKPMNDSMVKKIIDRGLVPINRKNKSFAHSYFPPVHFFAGNELPRSMDGRSKAYGRRLIVLQTDSFQPEKGNFTNDFEQLLLNEEKDGIVARLLAGAVDLINLNGNFSVTESSKELVSEMELNSDPYSQFNEAVKDGYQVPNSTSKIWVETGRRITVKKLWYFYTEFMKESTMGRPASHYNERRQLCSALRKLGWRSEKVGSEVYFFERGCGGEEAIFP